MLTFPLFANRTSGASMREVCAPARPAASGFAARFRGLQETPRYRQTFARLLGFLRPYKVSLGVSIVLAVAYQGAAIALIWLTKHVIDNALEARDREKLWLYVGVVAGVGVLRAAFMAARRLISGKQALAVE